MKSLVIFDSQFGNTQKIAEAITDSLPFSYKAKQIKADEVSLKDLTNINLLIVGSPTQGGRPKQSLQVFLDQIPSDVLHNVNVVSFDTRFLEKDLNFALRILVKTIGYAASKIANTLKNKGGKLIVPPEGFIVKGKSGPLAQGELERAKRWVKSITKQYSRL